MNVLLRNGNVTELTNASGTTVASYRYTAFGDLWSATGNAASANHYRFSTKPIDNEVIRSASSAFSSGLYYYGYRFYDPSLEGAEGVRKRKISTLNEAGGTKVSESYERRKRQGRQSIGVRG